MPAGTSLLPEDYNVDSIQKAFCDGCPHIREHSGTWNEYYGGTPPYLACPADFDPADTGCPRHESWQGILERISQSEDLRDEINELIAEGCDDGGGPPSWLPDRTDEV